MKLRKLTCIISGSLLVALRKAFVFRPQARAVTVSLALVSAVALAASASSQKVVPAAAYKPDFSYRTKTPGEAGVTLAIVAAEWGEDVSKAAMKERVVLSFTR